MKKHLQVFIQSTNMSNFNVIRPFLISLSCKVLVHTQSYRIFRWTDKWMVTRLHYGSLLHRKKSGSRVIGKGLV